LDLRIADANDMRRKQYIDSPYLAEMDDGRGNAVSVYAARPISEIVSHDLRRLAQGEEAQILPYVRKEVPLLNCDIIDFECGIGEGTTGKELEAKVVLNLSVLLSANAQYQKSFQSEKTLPLPQKNLPQACKRELAAAYREVLTQIDEAMKSQEFLGAMRKNTP
jgi:hypothetical protein